MKPAAGEFVTLARVVKTHSRFGEVAVEPHTSVADRFKPGMKLRALLDSGARRDVVIDSLWQHKGLLVLKLDGIDTISDAETLLRGELQVPSGERAELDDGWNFVSDLTGCDLFDGDRLLGQVEDVTFGAGEAPLLIVKGPAQTWEIPFAQEYLSSMDLGAHKIRMKLPEGMLDVNAPLTEEEKRSQRPRQE